MEVYETVVPARILCGEVEHGRLHRIAIGIVRQKQNPKEFSSKLTFDKVTKCPDIKCALHYRG